MKPQLQIERVESCIEWLETSDDITVTQSGALVAEHIGILVKSHAFVSGQMAVAKEILNTKKVKAYHEMLASQISSEKYFAPSLAKDFIAAKLAKEQYDYDISERCCRLLVHTIEAARSVLSYLKEESRLSTYSS